MPLTFSITVGIGAAFVAMSSSRSSWARSRQIHPLMWVVAIAFVIYFMQNWINAFI